MGRPHTRAVSAGVEYHRVFVGETRGIGRGIVAILLLVLGLLALGFLVSQVIALLDPRRASGDPTAEGNVMMPLKQAGNMITLALLIPWSMLIQGWLYGVDPSLLHSVASRFRFHLFGRAIGLIGPLWVAVILLSTAVPQQVAWSTRDLVTMFVVTLLLTPLQSAGEEYGLRGLVFRVAGSWSGSAVAGLVTGVAVSSVVFVTLHLSGDPRRNVYYLAPAVCFAIITWADRRARDRDRDPRPRQHAAVPLRHRHACRLSIARGAFGGRRRRAPAHPGCCPCAGYGGRLVLDAECRSGPHTEGRSGRPCRRTAADAR